jgi:hypothetical protein
MTIQIIKLVEKMITDKDLINKTNEFFNRYLNKDVNEELPEWSEHWNFNGSIPNHNKRGCYALFENEKLIYIGIGIGKSYGRYIGSGIGDRLKRYWEKNKENSESEYKPREGWEKVTSIMTIGFSEDLYFLAAALEIYLIKNLKPERNVQQKNN